MRAVQAKHNQGRTGAKSGKEEVGEGLQGMGRKGVVGRIRQATRGRAEGRARGGDVADPVVDVVKDAVVLVSSFLSFYQAPGASHGISCCKK